MENHSNGNMKLTQGVADIFCIMSVQDVVLSALDVHLHSCCKVLYLFCNLTFTLFVPSCNYTRLITRSLIC